MLSAVPPCGIFMFLKRRFLLTERLMPARNIGEQQRWPQSRTSVVAVRQMTCKIVTFAPRGAAYQTSVLEGRCFAGKERSFTRSILLRREKKKHRTEEPVCTRTNSFCWLDWSRDQLLNAECWSLSGTQMPRACLNSFFFLSLFLFSGETQSQRKVMLRWLNGASNIPDRKSGGGGDRRRKKLKLPLLAGLRSTFHSVKNCLMTCEHI